MSTHHPVYGQKLTRTQKAQMFGDDHSNDYRGIVQRDGKVAWILVKTGAQQTYPNEVTADCIKYCYSSKDGKANTAMKRAHQSNESFIVKVVPDKSTETYFWGMGKVSVEQEDYEWNGRMYRRFVVVKEGESTPTNPPTGPPTDITENIPEYTPTNSSVEAEAATTTAMVVAEGSTTNRSKRRREQAVVGEDLIHMASFVESIDFDSHLERCHAVMMSLLGIKWSRDAPTIPGIEMGSGRIASYTPDFVVDIPNGVYTQTYLIEIKPRYPYDDELRKAVGACAKMKVMPLFLFYHTDFRTPFAERWTGSGQGDYHHHEGIRGIKFSWNSQMERVVIEHDAAYTSQTLPDGSTVVGGIDVRTTIGDPRFDNPHLAKAYEAVSRFQSAS